MSKMAIDQVLAQIRSLSAQAGAAVKPVASSAAGLGAAAATGCRGTRASVRRSCSSRASMRSIRVSRAPAALADAWERGTPGVDLAKVMIESQKASVSFRALTEVRNRLVSAYQDIMNMSI